MSRADAWERIACRMLIHAIVTTGLDEDTALDLRTGPANAYDPGMDQGEDDEGRPTQNANQTYAPPGPIYTQVTSHNDRTDDETIAYRTESNVILVVAADGHGEEVELPK